MTKVAVMPAFLKLLEQNCQMEDFYKSIIECTAQGLAVQTPQMNTLARASAPALAMYGLEGWKATSKMLSSNFFLWAVISWTQVLLSRFHNLMLQS